MRICDHIRGAGRNGGGAFYAFDRFGDIRDISGDDDRDQSPAELALPCDKFDIRAFAHEIERVDCGDHTGNFNKTQ